MEKNRIEYNGQSLIINGKKEILIGGEFHYFRTPSVLWEDRLCKIKQAGCNLITSYIPWNFHEESEGKLNWEGDRDLPKFLKLCQKYGLYVIIKPGPYICAEWDFGGFPHWLLKKDIPLRVPDEKYLEIVRGWYQGVAKVINPFLVTNGGNIVLIQIENEYDHLIEEGDVVVSKDEAKRYLLSLLKFVREANINIPAFTNEGSCILGTEIINTHTYYPNIPWIWMWEFNDFDRKIEHSRKVQKEKPLMILELEAGWFAQFGKPMYNVETEVTDAIMKTVLAYGASVLNYYMVAGGTSFPYWSAKGDYGGIGICTTFDFGAAPVREWGEIHEKYHHLRCFAYFLKSFPQIILDGKTTKEDAEFIKGGEEIVRIFKNKVDSSSSFKDSFENVKILMRKSPEHSLVFIRNLEKDKKEVRIAYNSGLLNKKIEFPEKDLRLDPRSSLFLPVDFKLSDDLKILYSTSEILLKKEINGRIFICLKGYKSIDGEMGIISKEKIEIVKGEAKIEENKNDKYYKLKYDHKKINIFKINDHILMVLPEKEADKVWMDDDFIMLSDHYHLRELNKKESNFEFKFLVKPDNKEQKVKFWCKDKVRKVEYNGKSVPFNDKDNGEIELSYSFNIKSPNEIKWSGDWMVKADTEEKEIDFNDNTWQDIKADTPLEIADLFEHGYYWYRNDFLLKEGYDEVVLNLKTNEMDRVTVYINGKFRWIGIDSPVLDITDLVNPGKNMIAVSYENAFHTKAHPHEGPIKKLSGLYFPVLIEYKSKSKEEVIHFDKWKVQQGLGGINKKYFAEKINEKDWVKIPQALRYVFEEDMGNIVWLRRVFLLKKDKEWEDPLYINIKECHDRCLIFVNGFLLGKYEQVGPQNLFYVPENLLKEKNVLTMVVEGPGFHPVKGFGFLPPKLDEPEIGFYHEAKNIDVKISV